MLFQDNNHEEAHTLFIYQAVLASQQNHTDTQMAFFSPDTDVLVLVIANYDLMLKNMFISTATGVLGIGPIWSHRDRKNKGFASLPCIHGSHFV